MHEVCKFSLYTQGKINIEYTAADMYATCMRYVLTLL